MNNPEGNIAPVQFEEVRSYNPIMSQQSLGGLESSTLGLNGTQQHNYKFILVGNSHVGKTSLMNRCVFDEFDESTGTTRICQVVPMPPINIEGTETWVQVNLWDTLG